MWYEAELQRAFRSGATERGEIPEIIYLNWHNDLRNDWHCMTEMGGTMITEIATVKAGFVDSPLDWRYSSARNYNGNEGIIPVTIFSG